MAGAQDEHRFSDIDFFSKDWPFFLLETATCTQAAKKHQSHYVGLWRQTQHI